MRGDPLAMAAMAMLCSVVAVPLPAWPGGVSAAAETGSTRVDPAPPTSVNAEALDPAKIELLVGKEVRGAVGEKMGRIIDIVVDRTGQVRAAVIDFGGFLGVGSRKIAVSWDIVRFPGDGKEDFVTLDLTAAQLRKAPAFKSGDPIFVNAPLPEDAERQDLSEVPGLSSPAQ